MPAMPPQIFVITKTVYPYIYKIPQKQYSLLWEELHGWVPLFCITELPAKVLVTSEIKYSYLIHFYVTEA